LSGAVAVRFATHQNVFESADDLRDSKLANEDQQANSLQGIEVAVRHFEQQQEVSKD
jgi:hypothetical protein